MCYICITMEFIIWDVLVTIFILFQQMMDKNKSEIEMDYNEGKAT